MAKEGDGNYAEVAEQVERAAREMLQVTQAELEALGHLAVNLITLRTRAGVDADGVKFTPYSDAYKEKRAEKGRATDPDLIVTGHMLGAMTPVVDDGGVSITFNGAVDSRKAQIHNSGVSADVYVKPHSRAAYVDRKTGRRVSAKEAKRDTKRKKPRVYQRTEAVSAHARKMRIPKREFFDIRRPEEIEQLAKLLGNGIELRVEKKASGR